jgi:hypothetical protein
VEVCRAVLTGVSQRVNWEVPHPWVRFIAMDRHVLPREPYIPSATGILRLVWKLETAVRAPTFQRWVHPFRQGWGCDLSAPRAPRGALLLPGVTGGRFFCHLLVTRGQTSAHFIQQNHQICNSTKMYLNQALS